MAPIFNAAEWLVDRHVEEGRGERIAVRGSRTLTYAELAGLSGDVASSLRRLGVRRDDRVVFVMCDDVELLGGILGAFRAGVVAVPVSTMLAAHELAKVVADSGARVVCASPEYVDAVAAAIELAPEVEHLVLAGAGALPALSVASGRSWDDFIALGREGQGQDRTVAGTDEDACALWLYTSGTTGSPKGAMHRHANIRHVCQTYGDQVLGIRAQDVCLSVAKLFFAYGLGNSAWFPLSAGATTVLEPRSPTPQVIAERMSQGEADDLLRGANLLRPPGGQRPAGRHVRLGAPGDIGGRALAGSVAAPVHRAVRGADHRRHRDHREPEHLLVQPAR